MSFTRRLALLSAALLALRADAAGSLLNRSYVSPADGEIRLYDVYTPAGYDGVHPMPAILFLHGRGGGKSSFQTPGYENGANANGVVLVFWQGRFRPDISAFSTEYVNGVDGVPDETDVLACLDDVLARFAVDAERVHLAGFSQGGKGALLVGLKNPDRFASIVDGAGPSDAFQGQLWSPTFPDYAAAAGGPAEGASGRTLALWFAQSPRFLLPNARNVPLALFHGTADAVVPDSTALFPYRNTHHIADTPGFSDARGATATLTELHAADPGGYSFAATYPPGVGHDEEGVVAPAALYAFVAGKSRAARPSRVVARTFEETEKSFYWLRLARSSPPDGSAASVTADRTAGGFSLSVSGSPVVTLDLARAGLDPAAPFGVSLAPGSGAFVRLRGAFGADVRVARDGVLVPSGETWHREGGDVVLTFPPSSSPSRITLAPTPAEPVASDDLLAPALVEAAGLLGARFRTELVLANLAAVPATVEARLMGSGAPAIRLELPASSTRLFASGTLFAAFGLPGGASPLRLRVLAGDPEKVFAAERVFNDTGSGSYGLSFPVASAAESALGVGEEAYLLGGTPGHPSRTNLSLFAPFEASTASVALFDPTGRALSTSTVSLAPQERIQLGDVVAGVPAPARISVTVLTGRIQAYATVIDEASTNDPFRSPPLLRSRNARSFTVPAVAAAPGRNGARFTSDLYLAALPGVLDFTIPVTVTFLPRGGGAARAAEVSLLPGTTRVLEDVVSALFPGAAPAAGALAVDASFGIQILAVTRSDSDAGPASQDLPAVRAGDEATPAAPALFVGLAESPDARSNLVLVNRGGATQVTLRLFAEDGERGSLTVSLGAGEVTQLDAVASLFPGGAVGAGAILVAPASGSVVASVVRIDNRTNDPAGLAPLPAPALALALAR